MTCQRVDRYWPAIGITCAKLCMTKGPPGTPGLNLSGCSDLKSQTQPGMRFMSASPPRMLQHLVAQINALLKQQFEWAAIACNESEGQASFVQFRHTIEIVDWQYRTAHDSVKKL